MRILQLRKLSRLTIFACIAGVLVMLLISAGLARHFRGHVAAVETLDELQYVVAELGVNVGAASRGTVGTEDLGPIRDNLARLRELLPVIRHGDQAALRGPISEMDSALDGIESGLAEGDTGAIAEHVERLHQTEARLTLLESQLLKVEHARLEQQLMWAVAGFALFALGFGGLTIAAFATLRRRVTGPVQNLIEATRRAGRGELEQRVDLDCDDEFGELGRSFNAMLQRQQEHEAEIRRYQAQLALWLNERQMILDALPSHVAVLDHDGVIRGVNQPWREFGLVNDAMDPQFGVGQNYLAICDRARGPGSEGADAVADGIRAVLAGRRRQFVHEYPCHSPTEKRWYHVLVRPFEPDPEVADSRRGAVVTHFDVSARRRAEAYIREQNRLLEMAGRMARFGGWSVDLATETISWSEETAAIHDLPSGHSPTLAEGIGFYAEGSRERIEARWQACVAHGTPWDEELELVTAAGRWIWVRTIGEAERDADGSITEIRGALQEITERKRIEQRLERLAYEDELTGLPSRLGFLARLETLMARAPGDDRRPSHLVVLDLLRLNDINQAFGYELGNRLLQDVAGRIGGGLDDGECVGRLGGDQFGIALAGGASAGDGLTASEAVAGRVDAMFDQPFVVDEHALNVDVTFGLVALDGDIDVAEAMRRAQLAFHTARADRGRHCVAYDAALDRAERERVRMTQDLRGAVERGEFELHYQPKVRLRDGGILAVEALLRWHHPQRGLQRPDLFIPAAEHSKVIVPIGEWIIREACERLREWQARRLAAVRVAVNVSMVQVLESDLAATVARIVDETGIEPRSLSLEITESMLEADPARVLEQMTRLRALGVRLSLDDFGTGYASLSHLHRYPFDEIKIDRSFVDHSTSQAYSREIVRMVISVASVLGFEVVAEGIEERVQCDLLMELGCAVGQGYYYSMPLAAEDLDWLLEQRSSLPLGADAASAAPG